MANVIWGRLGGTPPPSKIGSGWTTAVANRGPGRGRAQSLPRPFPSLCAPEAGRRGNASARSDGSCGPADGAASSRVPWHRGRRPEVPAAWRSRRTASPSGAAPPRRAGSRPRPLKACAPVRVSSRILSVSFSLWPSGRPGSVDVEPASSDPAGSSSHPRAPSRARHPERTVPTSSLDTALLLLARHLALPPDPVFL